MKPTTIEFSFDGAKLEAINIFLKDKDATLNDERDRFMDALYKKHVPQVVREFIERKESEDAKAITPQQSTRKKPSADRSAVLGDETDGGAYTDRTKKNPCKRFLTDREGESTPFSHQCQIADGLGMF